MTMARRLERLTSALSTRELFLLALGQYRCGTRMDVDLSGLSPAQHDEFMGFARVVMSYNLFAGGLWPLITQRAGWLEDDLDRIANLDQAADELERLNGWPRSGPVRNWRKAGEMEVPAFLRGLAAEQRAFVATAADQLWRELDAGLVLEAEAAEDVGEEVSQQTTAASYHDAERAVAGLRRRLGLKKDPRPDAAVLAHFRACLNAIKGADECELPR